MHKGPTNIMFSFSGTAKSGQMKPNCNDYFDCLIKKKKKKKTQIFSLWILLDSQLLEVLDWLTMALLFTFRHRFSHRLFFVNNKINKVKVKTK